MELIYPCLLNVEFQIRTLEDKDGLGNYKWVPMRRAGVRSGSFVHTYRDTGDRRERQGLKVISPCTILDVDGQHKRTFKTEFFRNDGTYLKQPQYGSYDRHGKKTGLFHGKKSCNWIPIPLSAQGIITFLNWGFSIVPGQFRSPLPADEAVGRKEAESQRAKACLLDWGFYLWDHDEWSDAYPSCSPEELLCRHPTLRDDFYWGGESISSRSFLKPDWRYRLMSIFGEPIDDPYLMDVVIDVIADRYPAIARSVATDKVHISYGNGSRAERYSEIYGGELTSEFLTTLKTEARQRRRDAEEAAALAEEKKVKRQERTQERQKRRNALIAAGVDLSDAEHPWTAFSKIPVAMLLTELGWATLLSGEQWNWHGSGPGKSFELDEDVIKPFSASIRSATPSGEGKPIQGHVFIAYRLFGLDVRVVNEQPELYRKLAEHGYGRWVDREDFRCLTQAQTVTAIRRGAMSPLALKRSAPILEKSNGTDLTVLSTLQDNREAIQNAFSRENRIVLLRADTGVGKDFEKVGWILNFDGKVIESTTTSDLAIEKELVIIDRAASDREAYRWRGLMSGWKENRGRSILERKRDPFPDGFESLCIKAPCFNALRNKGANPYQSLCSSCPVLSQCDRHGYRSQMDKAQAADYVVIADRNAFFHPAYDGFVDQLILGQKAPVGVIDELKVHEMFIECKIGMAELRSIKEMWGDALLGRFADVLLRELTLNQAPDFTRIREIVQSQKRCQEIQESFTKVRLLGRFIEHGTTDEETGRVLAELKFEFDNSEAWAWVANSSDAYGILLKKKEPVVLLYGYTRRDRFVDISLDQALAFECFQVDDLNTFDAAASVECLPRVYPENWTPFHQLQDFFSTYHRLEDAPIEYSAETLSFYCRPQLHPKLSRLIMMSATLQSEVIRDKVFPNVSVTVVDALPAEWAEGVKVYQIITGKYPRQSVLEYDGAGEVIGLWQFGKKAVDMFLTEAAQNPGRKYAIITYKAVLDLIEKDLQNLPNVVVANYGAAEGENEKYADVDVFWIMFAPFLPPQEVKRRAKLIYGADSEPLDYTRGEDGIYVDSRMQSISDAAVQNELIQAVGRARLVRRKNVKVVILTGAHLKGITDREETVLFDYEDYLIAGSLDKLEDVVQKRESDIAQIRQMHADGASKAGIQEIFRLSYRRVDAILPSEMSS